MTSSVHFYREPTTTFPPSSDLFSTTSWDRYTVMFRSNVLYFYFIFYHDVHLIALDFLCSDLRPRDRCVRNAGVETPCLERILNEYGLIQPVPVRWRVVELEQTEILACFIEWEEPIEGGGIGVLRMSRVRRRSVTWMQH